MPPLQVHLALAVMLAVDFCRSLHGASVSFSCILCAFDCVRVQVRVCSSVRVPEYNFVFYFDHHRGGGDYYDSVNPHIPLVHIFSRSLV